MWIKNRSGSDDCDYEIYEFGGILRCLELISRKSCIEKKSMALERECRQETGLKFWQEEEPRAEKD